MAAAAAEAEEKTAGGEDEVPAELLEVHLDLVNTAGLVLLLLLRADIPGPSAVSFVRLVPGQFLLASPSYEPPRSGPELLPEPLDDVLRPQEPQLLAGHVLREKERGGEREEQEEVSGRYHRVDWLVETAH